MKRILFYTDTSILGGAEVQMLLLAKYLSKEKYSVTLACSSNKNLNSWCQKWMEAGLDVVRIPVKGKHDPRHLLYLRKIVPKYDLVHLHVWNPASCRYGYIAARNKPLVITEHDPFVLKGVRAWVKSKFIKKVHEIIVPSHAGRAAIVEQDPQLESKITVIHNGIDIDEWNKKLQDSSREELREKLGITSNQIIILCVAELHERKGQITLIEATKKLATQFPQLVTIFVGDGPARSLYESLSAPLKHQVQFLGRVKEIAPLMLAADLFVLPSNREAFGLVLLEAGLAQLPIVASNVGGIPEIIKDKKTGLLTSAGDSNELAERIIQIMGNHELATSLGEQAMQRVTQEFSAQPMASATAQVYDKLLNPTP